MNKKPGRKITREVVEEVCDPEDEEEVPPKVDDGIVEFQNQRLTTLESRIGDFMARANLTDDDDVVYYLYKFDSSTSTKNSFIEKFTGEPPDEDAIGRRHGGGKYRLVMYVPPRNGREPITRTYILPIHERYDKLMKEAEAASANLVPQSNVIHQYGADMGSIFGMIERVMGIISPLLNRQESPTVATMMKENMLTVSQVMREMLLEDMRTRGEMMKMAMLPGKVEEDDEKEEEEDISSVVEKILPLISEWMPKLLGNDLQSKAVSTVVRGTPMFAQIVKDKSALRKLIKHLDDTQGREATDQALALLKIKRI